MDVLRQYNADGLLTLVELTAASGVKVTIAAGSLAYVEPFGPDGAFLTFAGGQQLEVRESYEMLQQILLNAVRV